MDGVPDSARMSKGFTREGNKVPEALRCESNSCSDSWKSRLQMCSEVIGEREDMFEVSEEDFS